VSTTAVRVAVSSGADPYSALLAGLAAADSPLHMTSSVQVVDWLAGALTAPQDALDAALARGRPPGFGHVVYTEQDPRAQVLLDVVGPDCPAGQLEALRWLEAELLQRRGWVLNVDTALALLVLTYGLPRWAGATIFACARTAGWTAHAVEELAEPGMRFRLRGVYSGPRA
jgi:citrate synthase